MTPWNLNQLADSLKTLSEAMSRVEKADRAVNNATENLRSAHVELNIARDSVEEAARVANVKVVLP